MKKTSLFILFFFISVKLSAQIAGKASICVGSTVHLSTTLASGTWSSENDNIASVDESGIVKGAKKGIVAISYKTEGNATIFSITVSELPKITAADDKMCAGSIMQVSNEISGGTWSTANTMANVDPGNGTVTAKSAGTITITYTLNECVEKKDITINALPDKIEGLGAIYEKSYTVLSDNQTGTWTSSDANIATVDNKGHVYGVKAGTTNIILTDANNCTATHKIVINSTTGSAPMTTDEFVQVITDKLNAADQEDIPLDVVGNITLDTTSIIAYSTSEYAKRLYKKKNKKYVVNIDSIPTTASHIRLDIKSITFNIANGNINFARLKTIDDNIFENDNLAFSLVDNGKFKMRGRLVDKPRMYTRKGFRNIYKNNLLYSKDGSQCIILNDVITYKSRPNRLYYIPDDDTLTLTSHTKSGKVFKNMNLNNNVDFRIYSDLLGLFNKQSNGIIQSDLKAKIFINTAKVGKWNFCNYIAPSFTYSKFDDKNHVFNLNDSSKVIFLSDSARMALYQLSYVTLGLKGNLVRVLFGNNYTELNAGMEFNFSNVKMSNTLPEVKSYNTWSYYIEGAGEIRRYENFGLNYSVKALIQSTVNTAIQVYEYKDLYLIPELEAFYFLNESYTNKVFIKFRVTNHSDSYDRSTARFFTSTGDIFDVKRAFYSLQIGYNAKLVFKK